MLRFLLSCIFVPLLFQVSWSQKGPIASFAKDYVPKDSYKASSPLTGELSELLSHEFDYSQPMTNKDLVKKINAGREKRLTKGIGSFVRNDSLENFVNAVFNNLITTNQPLHDHKRILLIQRDGSVNAYCYGRGIFVVTTGFLARMTSEDQLAFAFAHEIAHDELDHVRSRILQMAKLDLEKRTKEQTQKILAGTIDIEEIAELKAVIYGLSRYSRAKEMQADSMAAILLNKAGYDRPAALTLFDVFASCTNPMTS